MTAVGTGLFVLKPSPTENPAKFAKGLIFRIVDHAFQEGWLTAGDTVIDPFSGVALGALPLALRGIQYVGCELESRFHALAQANCALWQRKYGVLPQWVAPVLVCGDSRRLTAVLTGADVVVSSPPFCDSTGGGGRTQIDCLHTIRYVPQCYNMHGSGALRQGKLADDSYGATLGQLGNLPPGSVDAAISSPPYQEQVIHARKLGKPGYRQGATQGSHSCDTYGQSPQNLGNNVPATFWAAARTILEQVFQLLKPGGHALWVVKAYCRKGVIVDFPGDWTRLCQHIGFELLHEHHALLVESHSEDGLFGEPVEMYHVERKSFFRRLHEAKRPDLAINHETVFCMMKSGSTTAESGIDACVASPPYNLPMSQDHNGSKGGIRGTTPSESGAFVKYGNTPGQLEGMPPGSIDAVIASPPYAASLDHEPGNTMWGATPLLRRHDGTALRIGASLKTSYGTTPGQLGAMPEGRGPR